MLGKIKWIFENIKYEFGFSLKVMKRENKTNIIIQII